MKESILKLLKDRYFLKNENSWKDIAKRISKIYPEIHNDILEMKFVPSSPTIMNLNTNNERKGTLSSCFPMKVKDSIENIYDALKECAIITRNGGGVGYDFSFLRGSRENIKTLNRNSGGPLPFISNFNDVLNAIRQGGIRKGAGSAILDIEHPDILEFIRSKDLTSEIKKLVIEEKIKAPYARFNFSIKITNKFYDTLIATPNKIHQIKLMNNKYIDLEENNKKITVKELWDEIINKAWSCAEPGIINYDIAWERCSVKNVDNIILQNPCFEFINIPYSACNLGSIDLAKFVDLSKKKLNWEELGKMIDRSIIYLNKIIDHNYFPLEKIKKTTLKIRPIGLGTMGLAHLFYKLNIAYNSEEALELTEKIYKYITIKGMKKSVDLAKKEGSYPTFDHDIFMKANERFFKEDSFLDINIIKLKKDIKKYGIRNSCITSIAPTGSISTIVNTSGGIEPIFALTYKRKIEKEKGNYDIMYITDSIFEEYLNKNYSKDKEKILNEISKTGSCQNSKFLTNKEKQIFITANDLTPMEHLNLLEKVANNINLSASKTINLPANISKEEISEVYLEAYKKGIIGVTVYRKGSREGILLTDDNYSRVVPKRPKVLSANVHKVTVKGEKWVVLVGLHEDRPYEVFAGKVELIDLPSKIKQVNIIKNSKRKYQIELEDEIIVSDINKVFSNGNYEAITRLISTSLRHNVPLHFIIEQINKSKGTLADYEKCIARALKTYIKEGTVSTEKCPECNQDLIFAEGCVKCLDCLWSRCG